jgi:hypothetical protein
MTDDRKSFLVCRRCLLDLPRYCLCLIHSQPSVLFGPRLSSSHVVVVSQVPSYNHSALIVFLYWPSLSSILLGVDSLQAMLFWSRMWLHVSISIYCPREYRLWSRRWSISLEVLTLVEDVTLNIGIWERVQFPFWASDRVGPRRPSNETQHQQSHEVQSDTTRYYVAHTWKEKWHGWPRSPPSFQLFWCPFCYAVNVSFIISSAPSFINLRMRFLLRGGL